MAICTSAGGEGLQVICLPEDYGVLSPIRNVVALQLPAYHSATARARDVDKPSNLAKSETVDSDHAQSRAISQVRFGDISNDS